MAQPTARDVRLLDAIEALTAEPFDGTIWRVVRQGRDPLQCSSVGGRWDDRTFDVLYTSTSARGSIAEMYFHLSRGQPLVPSLVQYELFELRVSIRECIHFRTLKDLESVGLQTSTFGQLSYSERVQEYPRTQEIGEAAYFLGHHGLVVPSARSESPNVIIFCDRIEPGTISVAKNHGAVDWNVLKQR
ncbi:MAG: RES family NAD+ phosphorylase [Rhizomicrobium sp.]